MSERTRLRRSGLHSERFHFSGGVIAETSHWRFVPFSAVLSGVPELRQILAQAKEAKEYDGGATILFVDELHRFNRAQQDALERWM